MITLRKLSNWSMGINMFDLYLYKNIASMSNIVFYDAFYTLGYADQIVAS